MMMGGANSPSSRLIILFSHDRVTRFRVFSRKNIDNNDDDDNNNNNNNNNNIATIILLSLILYL